jgi:hypothetical protein
MKWKLALSNDLLSDVYKIKEQEILVRRKENMLNTLGETKEYNLAGDIHCSFPFVKFLIYSTFHISSEKKYF